MTVRIRTSVLAAVAAVFALVSCVSAMQMLDAVAAVIGDEPVLVSELEAYMLMRINELKLRPDSASAGALRRKFLDEIIEGKVLLAHARKDSTISVSREEIEAALAEHLERLKHANQMTQEQLEIELSSQGMSFVKFKGQLRRSIEEQLLRRNVHQKHLMSVEVTRRDVEEFFAQYKDSLPTLGESYRMLKIVVTVPTPDSVRQAAYERMRGILTRLENGEQFEELAVQFSDGPNAKGGGDLGFVAKGTLNELSFEEAVFSLALGETSDIVETRLGFHIVKVEEKKDQKVHVRQILISVTPPASVEEEVTLRLDSIRTTCTSAELFSAAAAAHSVEARSRTRGGDIGWVSSYALPSAVVDAFDSLRVDAVSAPVREDGGIAVYFAAEHIKDRVVSLKDDYDLLAEKARDILAQKKMAELAGRWREGLYIDIRIE